MKPKSRPRGVANLVVFSLLCLGYTALLHFHVQLTGTPQIDGIIGVLLGLLAAVQPAANALDLILFGRHESVQALYRNAGARFWLMNLFVFFTAWAVISTSLLRYSRLT